MAHSPLGQKNIFPTVPAVYSTRYCPLSEKSHFTEDLMLGKRMNAEAMMMKRTANTAGRRDFKFCIYAPEEGTPLWASPG